MDDDEMNAPRWIVAGTVAIHCLLIPAAIVYTHRSDGFVGALNPQNQATWTPIVHAQSIMLALYFGFAARSVYSRFAVFCIGLTCVLFSYTWARSMLFLPELDSYSWEECLFGDYGTDSGYWVEKLFDNALFVSVPWLVLGMTLLVLRTATSMIRRTDRHQFRILGLLLITLFWSAIFACYKYFVTDQLLNVLNLRRNYALDSLQLLTGIGSSSCYSQSVALLAPFCR